MGHRLNVVVLGVNYASCDYSRRFVAEWSKVPGVTRIFLVDNFSLEAEREDMRALARATGATLLERPNDGYGAALNEGIASVLREMGSGSDTLVLFGNVDVLPVSMEPISLGPHELPELGVLEGGRDRNPFLTRRQHQILPLMRIPLWLRSPAALRIWSAMAKALRVLPSATWAVHGSFFAATTAQLAILTPAFDAQSFLYCEELFFARRAEALKFRFRRVPVVVRHVGAVSTGAFVKSMPRAFFEAWSQSARRFFGR